MSLTTYLNSTTSNTSAGYGDSDVQTYLDTRKGVANGLVGLDVDTKIDIDEIPPLFINNHRIQYNGQTDTTTVYDIDHPIINGIQYAIVHNSFILLLNHTDPTEITGFHRYYFYIPGVSSSGIRFQFPFGGNFSVSCQLMRHI